MMGETLHDELRERELFPHQVEFIETVLGSGSGRRLILADAIGLLYGLGAGCMVDNRGR
jgi:hypothetical protein